eukprot:6178138-Pleurochrysis_carterae.AAC.1
MPLCADSHARRMFAYDLTTASCARSTACVCDGADWLETFCREILQQCRGPLPCPTDQKHKVECTQLSSDARLLS